MKKKLSLDDHALMRPFCSKTCSEVMTSEERVDCRNEDGLCKPAAMFLSRLKKNDVAKCRRPQFWDDMMISNMVFHDGWQLVDADVYVKGKRSIRVCFQDKTMVEVDSMGGNGGGKP